MDSTLVRLLRHLRESAKAYYPDLGPGEIRVDCLGSSAGRNSSIYRFRLRSGRLERRVVVKLPPSRAVGHEAPPAARPRIAPRVDPGTKNHNEHVTLRAVAQHFEGLCDTRFGSVRMLGFLSAEQAIVMEETRGRPLTHLLAQANRLWRPLGSQTLQSASENTGAWLRAYHDLPALEHTWSRDATREEFVVSVQRLASFLGSAHPPGQLLAAAASRVEALASLWLPPSLPLGTSHGDLAPRNVIVDPSGRVTPLDTRAAWRAPIYEDIAYFLTAAKTPRAQAASLGLAFGPTALGRVERAFLHGYFGSAPIPIERIRLFELQSLLDKWASRTEARERTRGLSRVARAYGNWSGDRLLHRSVASVLAQLEAPELAA